MIPKMYSSLYFVLITYVMVVTSDPSKKEAKGITLDYFDKYSRRHSCIFPPASLYTPEGKDRFLLQPCNTTDGTKGPEACSTFFYVSLRLCKVIINDNDNNSKALVSKFEVNVTDEAMKLEDRLCQLSGPGARVLSYYATYMKNSSKCEQVCNNSKRLCALLVVGLCKLYSSPLCDPPPVPVNKTIGTATQPPSPVNNPTTSASAKEPLESSSISRKSQSSATSTSTTTTTATTTVTKTERPEDNGRGPNEKETESDVDPTDGDDGTDFTLPPIPPSAAGNLKKSETSSAKKQETDDSDVTNQSNTGKEIKPQDNNGAEEEKPKKPVDNNHKGKGLPSDSDIGNNYNEADPLQVNDNEEDVDSQTENRKGDKKGGIINEASDKKQKKGKEKSDEDLQNQKKASFEPDEESHGSGHFIAYFLTAVVICVAGYIIFHNKQKIFAFFIEGRNAHSRRQRSKGVKYAELKSNVEEVMPSLEKTAMAKNFVY